ncbi:hypothetical protein [Nannocystis sp. SCPEA4]|uniref:hypothetical protein n=1 Tax=Nannocystis sp. SCPEA4 TaxID=2996787 RepID=UPI00226E9720|nr:hypothetical protein [Nannocystis sp. SCPEA4]MCY1062135.1 hypothetical protein [Nannocystis sp. SCPEA4]
MVGPDAAVVPVLVGSELVEVLGTAVSMSVVVAPVGEKQLGTEASKTRDKRRMMQAYQSACL